MSVCHDKKRYRTRAEADRALREIKRYGIRRGGDRKPTRWYACGTCNGFHLTSMLYFD